MVLDTNVVVSAMRSRAGAAFQVLRATGGDRFDIAVSVPLVLEYEAAVQGLPDSALGRQDVAAVLDYLCAIGKQQQVFYLWRPALRDPNDDMVLELAVAAQCDAVITYNRRDFEGAERFGIQVWRPIDLLTKVGWIR